MKKLKVAVIGAGQIASGYDIVKDKNILTHAKAIKHNESLELLGFYDNDKNKALEAAQKWGTVVIESIEYIEENADVICIAVPDAFHYDYLKRFTGKNNVKAVIIEKPLTDCLEKVGELEERCERDTKLYFVNYSRRFISEFQHLKTWINHDAGKLICGACYYGKGVLHNCSHLINLFLYLFEEVKPLAVTRNIVDYSKDDPSAEFLMKIDEATVAFFPIPCTEITVFDFDLFFENGKIHCDGEKNVIVYYKKGSSVVYRDETNYIKNIEVQIDGSSAMRGLYKNVCDVLNGNGEIVSGIHDAAKTVEICCEIRDTCLAKNVL
ncbi:MAG: Gfo/Idh/MocA family oxidoreductase [Lachnospiraceae bacterium]|nr:Gfo/Idh/MocA family oxidoreductase [Lachnospiraceae bacterium]